MFAQVRRSTLLQHFPYAPALRHTQQLGARHGVIHMSGSAVGILQLGEVGLFGNAIHAISLDRGPLWFEGCRSAQNIENFLTSFACQFPRRLGRKRRILPEIENSELSKTVLEHAGMKPSTTTQFYKTVWLDLAADEASLRAGLKGKWRNILSKSERSAIALERDDRLRGLDFLLVRHEEDRRTRRYSAPSSKLMAAIIAFMAPRGEVLLLHAKLEGRVIASVLVLIHGIAATYQIGWTSGAGRHHGAHHRLLWRAMLELKARGVRDFDLGGLNEESAEGVSRFKSGIGGRPSTLIGMFH